MSSTPIATTAARARERLAATLAALQQDGDVPEAVLNIVRGIARAIGPLFQLEKGGEVALLFQARAALQETLAGMQQSTDQDQPAVADATAAIAQALGMLFVAIREHNVTEPGAPPAAAAHPEPHPEPQRAPAPVEQPIAHAPTLSATPQPAPVVAVAPPVAEAVPLVQQAAQAVPLVQQAAQAVPLEASAIKDPQRRSKAPTMFPETAARPHTGPNGIARLEAELGVHSESNFYTDFIGDITNHGGIFVATWTAMAVGSPCEVELQFPGELRADVQGVVRWRRQVTDVDSSTSPGLGVEITRADNEAWGLIQRFISKRDPIIHDV